VYWQSQQPDDVGDPSNDAAFELKQASWADMTGLNYMTQVPLDVTASKSPNPGDNRVTIRLHNPSQRIAFFERAELTSTADGDEILPVEYSDNGVSANWVRVTGYNTPPAVVSVSPPQRS
jgi:exo-1,4-beta-D-glucosaminidase